MENNITNPVARFSLGTNGVSATAGLVHSEPLPQPPSGREGRHLAVSMAGRTAGFARSEVLDHRPAESQDASVTAFRDAAEAEARSWKTTGKKKGRGS